MNHLGGSEVQRKLFQWEERKGKNRGEKKKNTFISSYLKTNWSPSLLKYYKHCVLTHIRGIYKNGIEGHLKSGNREKYVEKNTWIKPVNPQGNQAWIFIGRTDAETEAPKLWSPDAKSRVVRKDPDTGKDWRQEEKGMTEDEMVEWHHWLTGHEFKQAPRDGEWQGSLASCSPWGHKEWDMTEPLKTAILGFGGDSGRLVLTQTHYWHDV